MEKQTKQQTKSDLNALKDLITKVDPNKKIYKKTSTLIDEYLKNKEEEKQKTKEK